MRETEVRFLNQMSLLWFCAGHPLETSPSALPARPHQPRWLARPWGIVLVADTAGAMQRGG